MANSDGANSGTDTMLAEMPAGNDPHGRGAVMSFLGSAGGRREESARPTRKKAELPIVAVTPESPGHASGLQT